MKKGNKTVYEIIKETKELPEVGKYTTYGITAYMETEQGKQPIQTISDISLNKETVIGMAEKFNREELSYLHFKDVVEDMMC